MADPAEGIDADGFITTGADVANIRPPFAAAVRDAVELCRSRCSPGFGLYVYGSVASGQARRGRSDLDLLLVVADPADLDSVADVGATLTRRHGALFREVSLATGTTDEILDGGPARAADRCFLKHYCVCVAGRDLTVDLPRCRPSPALAAGFAAETGEVLERLRAALTEAGQGELAGVARAGARKLLLTCAAIVSAETGGWTTDRHGAAVELSKRHPEHAETLARARAWSDPAATLEVDRPEVERLLGPFADWVVARLDTVTAR